MMDIRECIHYTFASLALCENKANPTGVCWNCPDGIKAPPITFSHHYSKLENPIVFTTIRRNDHFYRRNQVRWVRLADGKFRRVRIVQVANKKLADISTEFLLKDTDCDTREKAIELLNSFYKKPIRSDEELIILILEWIE